MFKKILSLTVIICFFLTTLGPIPQAHADSVLGLPTPGAMVNLSPAYEPVIIKGLTVHKDNPFLFDFIVDVGQDHMSGEPLKKEGEKLIKYFLASLAIPDKDLWVNLSPYEKNRMIPESLGQTDMGRDLLEQDYILKQITASLIYPERQLGKTFWDTVYAKAQEMYGTTQVPVNTFNKVWIMADKAEVFEHNQTAFVVGSHLKVMLEEDYLALQKHADIGVISQKATVNTLGSQIVRKIILPELEKEVNTGKNFANLRQMFNSIILSSWYKNNLKQAVLNQVYANQSKVQGINLNDPAVKELIYQQYLKAYKKGVFNYIKEDDVQGQTIPRKYFSGGMRIAPSHVDIVQNVVVGETKMAEGQWNGEDDFQTGIDVGSDESMIATDQTKIDNIAKNYKFKTIQNSRMSDIVTGLKGSVSNQHPSFESVADLIENLLRVVKLVKIQSGPREFFDELAGNGINVDSVSYKNSIIVRQNVLESPDQSKLLKAVLVGFGDLFGFSDLGGIFVQLSQPDSGPLSLEQINQLKKDIAYAAGEMKDQKSKFLANNVIPPAVLFPLLALIFGTELGGVGHDTKYKFALATHLLGITGLGIWQYGGVHNIIFGQIATKMRAGQKMLTNKATAYSATTIGLMGAVVAPIAGLYGNFFEYTAAVACFGVPLIWGLKKLYASSFEKNGVPTLEEISQNYGQFATITTRLPAGSAIAILLSGIWLTQLGHYQAGTLAWLAASFYLIGQFMAEGIFDTTSTTLNFAAAARKALKSGNITELLNLAQDDPTHVMLLWKFIGFIWYMEMMTMKPEAIYDSTKVPLDVLNNWSHTPIPHLHNITWGPLPYMLLYLTGFAVGGINIIAKNKISKLLAKQRQQSRNEAKTSDEAMNTEINDKSPIISGVTRILVGKKLATVVSVQPPSSPEFTGSLTIKYDDGQTASGIDLKQVHIMKDNAVTANVTNTDFTRGGIDLNTSSNMQWKVSKDGNDVEMDMNPAMIQQIERQGVDWAKPVIFKVTPVISIWSLAGLQAPVG